MKRFFTGALLFGCVFSGYSQMAGLLAARYQAGNPDATPRLVTLYGVIDLDKSGTLDMHELGLSLEAVRRLFKYEANDIGMAPEQFWNAFAGDCEDFAIFTAELLEYYGIEACIGMLAAPNGWDYHAVCLAKFDKSLSGKMTRYMIQGNSRVHAGDYTVIDYHFIGAFSDPRFAGWKLESVWDTKDLIGKRM